MSTKSSLGLFHAISAAAAVKATIVAGVFLFMRLNVNPLYNNPQCAMRLVNETNPVAYSVHPYWKDLVYDNSCADEKLLSYVDNQTNNGERFYAEIGILFWNVLGAFLLLRELYKSVTASSTASSPFSSADAFVKFAWHNIVSAVVCFIGSTLMLMYTHFEVDITFLCGGILHHAFADKPGINNKLGTLTEGYFLCGFFSRAFMVLSLYLLVTRDKHLKKYYSVATMIGMLQLLILAAFTQVGRMHPVYHEMSANGATPAMLNSWPYTTLWRAFKHCITHHDSGYSFSGDLFLDPVHDYYLDAFSYVHNNVFHAELGSFTHLLLSTVSDAVMGIVTIAILYATLYVGTLFLPRPSSPDAQSSSASAGVGASKAKAH